MKRVAQVLSALALAATLAAPCLFFTDCLAQGAMQGVLLGAAVVWLVATPFWMEHKLSE